MSAESRLLDVRGLRTQFTTDDGIVKAVDGVSLAVESGGTLGIVGESGCGKSVTALSVMQLLPRPKGQIVDGRILYSRKGGETVDITTLDPGGDRMRQIRGNEIAMVFQEPVSSLNPVFTVGEQIAEAVRLHTGSNNDAAEDRAAEMLDLVGISNPRQRLQEYPHQFSGGMRQRVMIAMGLSCDPRLLIADEPTTALDVTIEAQILKLMQSLQERLGMSIVIITHDLGVIGEMADNVVVMYAGKVIERGTTYQIFYEPLHPYTKGLLDSIPQIGRRRRLTPIEGVVPSMLNLPRGCYFAPRCKYAMDICRTQEPPSFDVVGGHAAKCWLYEDSPVDEPPIAERGGEATGQAPKEKTKNRSG